MNCTERLFPVLSDPTGFELLSDSIEVVPSACNISLQGNQRVEPGEEEQKLYKLNAN